ncbi:MAG: lysozyme inhibitor LprI family protein [Tateyamaria sp.]|uniref:lysozyme inhibitor LprI family protein n=1 Tax=Tateyamaria sp. TaxID=1929288 RepID=UPI00329EC853
MKKLLIFTFGLIALGMPSFAQDPIVDRAVIEACHAEMVREFTEVECVGDAANACQGIHTSGFDGGTTRGISQCLEAETKVWDELLNLTYLSTQRLLAEQEDDARSNDPDRTDTFRDAQRAWITFRDAECLRLFSKWQDGTIRSNVFHGCLMTMTAERAIALVERTR